VAGRVCEAARILADRRAEAAAILGVELDGLELACASPAALTRAAWDFIARTEVFMEGLAVPWHELVARAMGHELGEGWPARLSARWIEEMFRPTGLTAGLRLDLGPLPKAYGAASFARALERFGVALAEADGPTSGFFTVSRSPFDLRVARRGALFASLPTDRVFGTRVLGLGGGRAADQARGLTRCVLVSMRIDAMRVLLRGARSNGEEVTARALGAPLPAALMGVVPRLGPGDAVRFAGSLAAAADIGRLRDAFDEDWFRNPEAALAIRDEDARAGEATPCTDDELAAVVDEAVALLEERLC
jgi:hypothetical protein